MISRYSLPKRPNAAMPFDRLATFLTYGPEFIEAQPTQHFVKAPELQHSIPKVLGG